MKTSRREHVILLLLLVMGLVVSGWRPFDRATWWMEVAPILLALPVLIATGRRFPLTNLAYRLIFVHAVILMVGGHYTYARVPLGAWVQQLFDLSRNHYDRLGHLAQGFIPAILVREVLLRTSPLRPGKWLFFLVTCVCLAISAFYEFIEWWAAVIGGDLATDFLGTQGDVWDTQWDMFLAFLGAMLAQIILAQWHNRALERFKRNDLPA